MLAYSHRRWETTGLCNIARTAGLEINVTKTKCMRINANQEAPLTVDGQAIEEVDRFTYLGSHDCELRQEEQTRILRLRFCHSETGLEE